MAIPRTAPRTAAAHSSRRFSAAAGPARRVLPVLAALATGAASLPAQWGPVTLTGPPPSARSGALMAHDLLTQRTLLIGGSGFGTTGTELWSFDGGLWTQLQPAVLPPVRRRANIAVDELLGDIVLYGGQGTGLQTALDDTWLWRAGAWQQLTPAFSPGGLMWHGMCFDRLRNVMVTYGGRRNIFSSNEFLDETWEFSLANNTWTSLVPAQTPPPLHRPAMAGHPALGLTVLFGGEDSNGFGSDQTWTFDGSTWTRINQTGVVPPPRTGASLVSILTRSVVVLFGGRDPATQAILNDTWEHDGTQWREISNVYGGIYPPRADAAFAHDLTRDRILSFGGEIANGGLRQDTWEYGAQWQRFGLSCSGSAGPVTFTGVGLPRLGMTATAEVGNVPAASSVAFVAVGLSRTQWTGGSLPVLLTPLGLTNCRAYTSADLIVPVPANGGVAQWSFPIPSLGALVGSTFYLQGLTFDPAANPFGAATSNAATLVVGI
ncbi:MAG: kelch repeat-containing protein [Planctomycetota bacterium]